MNDERRDGSWIWQVLLLLGEAVFVVFSTLRDWTGPRRDPQRNRIPKWVRWSAGITAIVMIAIGMAVIARYFRPLPPAQPIPFSHQIHVQTKNLNCFFCHPSATYSSNAGMPSVEKCLLCHNVIASNFWPIKRISTYYRRGEPIPWKWVNRVPGFVRFQHQPHLARGIDCSQCHGNVAAMDRVKAVHPFDMNFCVTCHWRNNASASCFTCHY
ncbi:MAG: cytochrome c3 family protein [Armatimonadota bacterium]|nr:cytochrome c family protein [bacterium]